MMKPLAKRKPAKDVREKSILFSLIELYLKEGKPIGSNTLKDSGLDAFSSATIRNYFMKLEEEGLLKQQHSSGGRVPTTKAFRLYAHTCLSEPHLGSADHSSITQALKKETREVASYLLQATERVSEITGCAAFLSAPRFDHDFILDIKLVYIDQNRLLCVLLTDFGLIKTETLYTDKKLSTFTLKRLENYLNWKLTGIEKPSLDAEEELLGAKFYKEIMLRHIVSHSNFSSEDLFQAGFSRLLGYSDFNDAVTLAQGLSLFENKQMLKNLLAQVNESAKITCWIGEDLTELSLDAPLCSVIAIPYRVNQTVCGAIGILGPTRLPYRELFAQLQLIADTLSDSLTKSVYKFKISFRNPKPSPLAFQTQYPGVLEKSHTLLLEDQSPQENR